ncbi:MAG TPA: cytochrome c oxidase accessory protein CcoG [Usitatibacter sp.]|nr:cytochrome c oxidase accessory protein CcoG [Usitatibacter sp.]
MNARIPVEVVEQSLYEDRKKVYPRAVSGWFARWRWSLVLLTQAIFYGLAWVEWNGRQAVLFDLAARKFYLFGLVLWPQDVVYLAVLLIVSALSLFLFTAIAGRLWCGYACPQTVYTEIFLWIERRIEGDRAARMKLDASPRSARKVALKSAKHASWIVLSIWTGFTFVGYFTPVRDLVHSAATVSFGPWELFWVGFYSLATYGNAGWLREQVCKYMCPYARFQSAMFDQDTLVVTYDAARGDPRGGRGRKADPRALGLGDCVDCSLCVQVCPTGIDIRDGLQYECIGCTSCIDACNQVMDKMGYPRGLIRYSTENAIANGWDWARMLRRVLRPRVLVYGSVLCAIVVAGAASMWMRVPVKMDIMRDRASLAREAEGGRIENVYRIVLMNTQERERAVLLGARGARGEPLEVLAESQPIALAPLTTRVLTVRVRAEDAGRRGSQPVEFVLESRDDATTFSIREKSRFLFPSR